MPCLQPFTISQRHLTIASIKPKCEGWNPRSILGILHSCKSLKRLEQIHAQLITTAEIENPLTAAKMVESYAVSGRYMDFASRVFFRIDRANSYAWSAMIRSFVKVKNPEKPLNFMGSNEEGCIAHGRLMKLGFCGDSLIRSALIHMYAKCGDVCAARTLFDEMPGGNNLVVWNSMVSGYFCLGDVENGHELFDKMAKRNIESWNAVIGRYSKLGHVHTARSLFDMMPGKDLVSWDAMISGYVQNSRAIEALELFKEMQFDGIPPDCFLMTSIITVCSQIGALDMGKWMHAHVSRNKFRFDIVLGTSLVDMYAKCGCNEIALNLFHSRDHKNLCSSNAIRGHGFAALSLSEEMESAIVKPDEVTFVAVLSACSHIGSVDEGWKQFKLMIEEFNIAPKIEHYGCIVDMLGRGRLINEAIELTKSMLMEPNIVVWGALLNACKIHGYATVGEDVIEKLQKLAIEDGGCHVLLSNIFAV